MKLTQHEKRGAIVWGAGGFVGGELLRLLVGHPHFELRAALSRTLAGKRIGGVLPNLAPFTSLAFADPDRFDWDELRSGGWTVFAALAHGESMKALPPLLKQFEGADVNVVDLSGDFRLRDPAAYAAHYGREHTAEEFLGRFAYGLPEIHRERIRGARCVANPGCLATGAQMAIAPAAAGGEKIRSIAIDGKTGSSGAGSTPRETTHHPNRMNNFRAYRPLVHQHLPEIVGGWAAAGGSPETEIAFVPQMAPMVRGIFTTAYLFAERPLSPETVAGWYERYYSGAAFVRLVDESPSVAEVWGTNRCDLSITCRGRTIVICTAIDNLVKGASGQAIQNANLMNGWEETAGLLTPAPAPV